MKASFKPLAVILSILLIPACKKDKTTPPVLSTSAVTAISYTAATSGGNVANDGGSSILSKGICWNTSDEPTINNNKTTESGGVGVFTSNLTQLVPNTLYYVRAYATNSAGTGYGNQVTFTTSELAVPDLATVDITEITQTTAVSGGNVSNENGSSVTVRGVCWGTETNPTTADNTTSDGSGTGSFESNISGLTGNTTYYVRAYATNEIGTAYGNELTFKTNPILPTITTNSLSNTTTNSAQCGGIISDNGGTTITSSGVCWSTAQNPTIGDNTISNNSNDENFVSSVTGLIPNTMYYLRAYATNSVGTSYGNEVILKTYTGTVTDIDGNNYYTVTIGTQIWMAEDLKTTKLNDGTDIPLVSDEAAWSSLNTQGYCWYDNNADNKSVYGALYNGFTVSTGKMCPTGWHVPAETEWTTVITFLGGQDIAGDKLRESGTTHWISPNDGATNESGFTALPGGNREDTGRFYWIGTSGAWYSSTEQALMSLFAHALENDYTGVSNFPVSKGAGFSVRCVKD